MTPRGPFSYRADPSVPAFPDDRPVIVFDGDCALCSAFARFVLRYDRQGRFRLLPAQTPLGRALYLHYGLDPDEYETNVLIDDGVAWFKSAGSIRMAAGLGLPWSLARALRILPAPLLDRLYDLVARNRIRLFGRTPACYLTDRDHADRFLA